MSYVIQDMKFSFFCQKNRFNVNKKFELYFDYEMAIFDVNEPSTVQNSIADVEKKQMEQSNAPLGKLKVCALNILNVFLLYIMFKH